MWPRFLLRKALRVTFALHQYKEAVMPHKLKNIELGQGRRSAFS
jgi:hypothetical protein